MSGRFAVGDLVIMLRWLTAGESHGPALVAVLEGLPAGVHTTSDELAELVFSGLEMVDPGVVPVSEWRPDGDGPRPAPAEVNSNGGMARKR